MDFLTLKQVGKKLGMRNSNVFILERRGILPKRIEDGEGIKWDAQEIEAWRKGHKRYRNKKEIIKAIKHDGVFIITNEKNQRVFVDELGEFETYEAAQQALDDFAGKAGLKEIGKFNAAERKQEAK